MNPLRKLDGEASPGPWKATGDSYTPVVGPHQKTIRKGANKGEPLPGSEARVVALDNHAACSDPDCCQDSPYVAVAPSDAALIVTLRNALPETATLMDAAERIHCEDVSRPYGDAVSAARVAFAHAQPGFCAACDLTRALAALKEKLR